VSSNICANCGNSFPNKKVIDGKERVLNSREYCLECSSFGQHNTKQIHKEDELEFEVCQDCGREYEYDRDKGHRRNRCNSCSVSRRREAKKQDLVDYAGGECQDCGYDKCNRALAFHHNDPEQKSFGINISSMTKDYETLVEEVDKCTLLCSNCHMERHCGEHQKV